MEQINQENFQNYVSQANDSFEEVNTSSTGGELHENINGNKISFDERLQARICNCSNINVGEILHLFLKLSAIYSFTWTALLDIFKALNSICNTSALPETKYMLQKLLKIDTSSVTYHVLYNSCSKYLGHKKNLKDAITCTCGAKVNNSTIGSFFIQLDMKPQLPQLFSDKKVLEKLTDSTQRRKINDNSFEDLYDGYMYKEYTANGLL